MALREVIMGKALIFEPVNTGRKAAYLRGLPNGGLPIVVAFSVSTCSAAERYLLCGDAPMAIFSSAWIPQLRLVLLLLAGTTGAMTQAQTNEIQDIARAWVMESVKSSQANAVTPLRIEVAVGALDARLKLAPCGNMEPYLPVGAKLWGKTRVAVRCVDGISRWNVSLPVAINAWGKAWVVRSQLPAGAVITQSDVVEAEVNWAEESSQVLRDSAAWMGFAATRSLSTGQTLRADMVRPAQVFQAGTPVRVIAQGPGFQIASDGQAITAGVVGQPARVRMDSGRVASGIVLDVKTVKIEL